MEFEQNNQRTNRSMVGRGRGFTLIELLVVIGIIGILVAIVLPVMSRVRQSAQRTACMAQLKDIGNMFQMYLNENKQRVPRVNPMPSEQPPIVDAPSIVETLQPYHKGAAKVFWCRSDRIINDVTDTDQPNPNQAANPRFDAETYYEREGTSYSYNPFWNAFSAVDDLGRHNTWTQALKQAAERRSSQTPDKISLLTDFDPFHDKAGKSTSRNCLFADFHVGPRELSR
jgi:prepilin-type N-terminal cleavage/methylation domain-containing protein/prepilin-type processing-associated H-X9-DG protein